MSPKYSARFWDSLFATREYGKLVELSGALCCSLDFRAANPDYGLPQPAFVFVESLAWFAQAQRSGAWTYFEATSPQRQNAMWVALEVSAPPEFATRYALGMERWTDPGALDPLDRWIAAHDDEMNSWLWRLASENRSLFERTCG